MTQTDYRRLSDEEIRQYSQGEFHEATVIGALAREVAERREASRTQSPAEQKRYLKDGPTLRLVCLRFFRDMIQSERIKVYEAFGIDKDDLPTPLTLGIEQQVFDQLFVRAASITPPAPERSREEVGIKPLVWGKTSYGRPEVETIIGVYRVFEHIDGGWAATFKTFNLVDAHGRKNFATEEDAKAAAQADYEQRIKSALEPASHKGEVEHEAVYNGEGYSFTGQSRTASPAPLPVGVMDDWQPIETAPKDGTEVLVTGPLYNDSAKGRYRTIAAFKEDGWYENQAAYPEENLLWEPTHWTPLPSLLAIPAKPGEQG